MKTLIDLCTPRESVFDETKRDDTLDLTNLIDRNIDVDRFLKETYITEGIDQLLDVAFRRFKRRGQTGIIKLTQAMGGGKTHAMITLGLLAQNPDLRRKVANGKYADDQLGKVKVVSFTGRESDAPYGIWGEIAEQLGKKDQFKNYYSPLSAPGQTAWIKLLKGEPLLILLDELPPYLDNASSKTVGNSDLSRITTTALSNLFTAINKEELSNVCLVISDLRAVYEKGSELIQSSFKELESEVQRSSLNIEPVNNATDEVYAVLRKRLFRELPSEKEINDVAVGYKEAVNEAKKLGYTNQSPEEIFSGVKDSYPFHPSLRDLYARFRENENFQQTRGLIRLMRQVITQLYSGDEPLAKEKHLIGVYDFDLNDPDMFSKIKEIKSSLANAITHDVASNGKAIAEHIDKEFKTTITQDLAKLILVSSLADIPDALIGLSFSEAIAYICEPGRDIGQAKERLEDFRMRAWYLYEDKDRKIYFRHVKNINAEINSLVGSYDNESAKKEIREFLGNKFEPTKRDCFQRVFIFSGLDEITLTQEQVALVLTEPHPEEGLYPELKQFFEETVYKNRILFLTGQRNTMENLLHSAKKFRAINTIVERMDEERVPENDPQYKKAKEQQNKAALSLLQSARETFVTLYYPGRKNELLTADFLMEFQGNKFDGEEQIRKVLIERRKLETDLESEKFRLKCEERLFTRKQMYWKEIKERAATNTLWQWHIPNALDAMKEDLLSKEIWREVGDMLEKPPFPKEKTTVQVQELKRDDNTGEVTLKIIPRYGDKVHYEIDGPATTASEVVKDLNNFKTRELKLSFLCVDSNGEHETGEPVEWTNRISLKHRFYNDHQENILMELRSAPPVEIRYTTDGSNPKEHGAKYDGDFVVPKGTTMVLAVGVSEKQGLYSDIRHFRVPESPDVVEIDKKRRLTLERRYRASDTKETFETLESLKKNEIYVADFEVSLNKNKGWIRLDVSPEIGYDPDIISGQIKKLREAMVQDEDSNIIFEYRRLFFPSGKHFLIWMQDQKMQLRDFKEGEISQDD